MHINKVIILMHYYAYYAYKQVIILMRIILIMRINKVIIRMRYYSLLCV